MQSNKILLTFALTGSVLTGILAFTNNDHRASKTKATETGFAVVELFTSEGCSSCPSADALVAKILKEDKDKPVYILGYHVDYWNHLGWRDEFSNADYSNRQRRYAAWLKLDQVYTPQIVVNGNTEFVGSSEGRLRGAIQTSLQKPAENVLALTDVHFTTAALNLHYQSHIKTANLALLVAFVQKNAQSHVERGENGGHILSHVNIVRNLTTFTLSQQSGAQTVKLPAGFNPQNWEVISFVQNTATGQILSAQKVVASGV